MPLSGQAPRCVWEMKGLKIYRYRKGALRFISSALPGSAPVCAASPLLEHLRRAHVVPPQVALRSYRFTLRPRRIYHGRADCDRYDVPKRNCKLPSSPRRVSAPHSSADTPRSPPKRYLLLPPRLWCVLIIRIMIRSASEQALLSARPPLSRLFQSELHASFPSASHPPTGQGLEVASRLYSRLAAPSCPVPNDMLVASKCT